MYQALIYTINSFANYSLIGTTNNIIENQSSLMIMEL